MKFIDQHTIQLDRELSDIDLFVLDFIKALQKHTTYVIISGYVAILLGRTRATEDIDIFIPSLTKVRFAALYAALTKTIYWCLNGEDTDDLYAYLHDRLAIRFAKKDQTIPNFEIKFALKPLDKAALQNPLLVKTPKGDLFISSLERQIAFKRYHLKSDKDLEDAKHIEKVFKEHIDMEEVARYKRLIEYEERKIL